MDNPTTPAWRVIHRDGHDAPPVRVLNTSIITDGHAITDAIAQAPECSTLICWSGTLGESPFARDWATWAAPGYKALRAACARIAPLLQSRRARLLLRPHARHVLSDALRCRRFLDERATDSLGIALDAASMLERSMLTDAQDHTERAFELLAPVASVVMLASVEPAHDNDDDALPTLVPVAPDPLNAAFLGALVRALVPASTPLLLLDADIEAQLAALALPD